MSRKDKSSKFSHLRNQGICEPLYRHHYVQTDVFLAKLKSRGHLYGYDYKGLDKTEMLVYCSSSACLSYISVNLLCTSSPIHLSFCLSLPGVRSGAHRSDGDPFIAILRSWRIKERVEEKNWLGEVSMCQQMGGIECKI